MGCVSRCAPIPQKKCYNKANFASFGEPMNDNQKPADMPTDAANTSTTLTDEAKQSQTDPAAAILDAAKTDITPQKKAQAMQDMPQGASQEAISGTAAAAPVSADNKPTIAQIAAAKKSPKAKAKGGRITVKELDASKKRIHPRFAKGKYQTIRLITMYGFLVIFLLMPWLKWDGRQAIWFDVVKPEFYIFGATFLPQDFYFFAFVFMIAAILLFMVTVYMGRVWCGYVCPQTIYVHLYQYTEKLVIGERNKRIKFDKQKMSAGKFLRLFVLHSLWIIYSVITAFTFVALVAGVDALLFNGQALFFMGWSKMVWIFMALITFVTYINAAYMREQMCVHICPYGRFQSVMLDKDTLIVSYDFERGEPRGARKKGKDDGLGDCVDCTMCVQVCPTGIDIRNGLQVECIQCAACIDACNEIMDKVEKPRGLIRYTTERQLVDHEPTKVLSPRIFAYIFVLGALFTGAYLVFANRLPLEIEVRHDRKQIRAPKNGVIENSYLLKVINKTGEKQTYTVALEPIDGIALKTRFKELPLEAGEVYDWPVSLYAEVDKVHDERTPVTFVVTSKNGQYQNSQTNYFAKR